MKGQAEVLSYAMDFLRQGSYVEFHGAKHQEPGGGEARGRGGRDGRKFLEEEVWPNLPPNERGRALSKREKEKILGYGPEGV
jgi:hypothetical protein